MRRGGSPSEIALAALFFLAVTIVLTWPLAARTTDSLPDLWDAKLTAWTLHWDFHQTFRDPIHLYNANIFYPARYALAFSENLLGVSVLGFPLYAAGLSTLTVYNILFLLGMLLSGVAAWALAREVTGDPLASVAAGLVYAFCPWRMAQIAHIQFQWGAFLAWALLFLLRYLDRGRRRDVVLFGVCFGWNALCNLHYALFAGFLVALVLGYEGLVSEWAQFRPRLSSTVAATATAGILVLPLFVPYALASKLYGMQRGYGEIEAFSAVWTSFLSAGEQDKLYGTVTQRWEKPEGELFPGIAALLLALVAIAWRRRTERTPALRQAPPLRRRIASILDVILLVGVAIWAASLAGRSSLGPVKLREPGRIAVLVSLLIIGRLVAAFPRWSRFSNLADYLRRSRFGTRAGLFLAIALLGVVIALGTHTPYYRFLVESLGTAFRIIRGPARGVVLFDLGLAVLAAWGLSEILRGRRQPARLAWTAVALLALGLEYTTFPLRIWRIDATAPEVDRWLAKVNPPGGIVEWPLGLAYDFEHEFRSTAHWKPIVNGASGFQPPGYPELAAAMEKRPIPETVWEMLAARNAALLVFHPDQVDGETAKAYEQAIRAGIERGRIVTIGSFAHGARRDIVFRLQSAARFDLPADTPRDP